MRSGSSELTSAALLVASGLFMAAHAAYYLEFSSDDAYISFRYAARLAAGRGLTWSEGEPAEGYSNLLWVLLAALGEAAGAEILIFMRALAGLCGLGALVLVSLDPETGRLSPLRAAAAMLISASASVACWIMGGLEAPLLLVGTTAACWSAQAALAGRGSFWAPAVAASAVVLTRADGAVLWAGLGLGLLLAERGRVGRIWPVLVLPALVVLGQEAFRLAYHGDLVPNTARAKVTGTAARAQAGLAWSAGALARHAPLVALGALGAAGGRRGAWLALVPAGAWIGYVSWVGGDIFAHSRHLVPVLGCLALAGVAALERLAPRRAVGVLLILLTLQLLFSHSGNDDQRVQERDWVRAGLSAGRTLRWAVGSLDPLLAVDAAGTLPYASRLRTLDMLGLNDQHLALHPPPDWGRAIGHDLGDGRYVWEREPDLVAFNSAVGSASPHYRSGRELLQQEGFRERYQRLRLHYPFEGEWPVALFLVRKVGGRLGAVQGPRGVQVPAWLLAAGPQALWVDGGKRTLVRPQADAPATLRDFPLGRGRWRLEVPGGAIGEIRCRSGGAERVPGGDPEVLALEEGALVDVWVGAAGRSVEVEGVFLRRTAAAPGRRCVERPTWSLAELLDAPVAGRPAEVLGTREVPPAGVRLLLPPELSALQLALAGGALRLVFRDQGGSVLGRQEVTPARPQVLQPVRWELPPGAVKVDLSRGDPDQVVLVGRAVVNGPVSEDASPP